MNKEDVIKYIKEEYGVSIEYLWKKDPTSGIFRHRNGKWFGLVMNVGKDKLGLESTDVIEVLNLKCVPDMIGSLRKNAGIYPAYHMNKEHWITITLDGSVDDEKLLALIDISYELVENNK